MSVSKGEGRQEIMKGEMVIERRKENSEEIILNLHVQILREEDMEDLFITNKVLF